MSRKRRSLAAIMAEDNEELEQEVSKADVSLLSAAKTAKEAAAKETQEETTATKVSTLALATDLTEENKEETAEAVVEGEFVAAIPSLQTKRSAKKKSAKKKSKPKPKIEVSTPVSEYIPISVTIPPEMFDRMQQISLERRKRRESYSMSKIVRDALDEWLPKHSK